MRSSTPRRLLAPPLNGDALEDNLGAWLARYATGPVDEADDTQVGPAVDAKSVRGSRTGGAAVHLRSVGGTAGTMRSRRARSTLVITACGRCLRVVKPSRRKLRKQS